jgi:hypothetical protein
MDILQREEPRGNLEREHRWRCCGLNRGSQSFKGVRHVEPILFKSQFELQVLAASVCRRGLDS